MGIEPLPYSLKSRMNTSFFKIFGVLSALGGWFLNKPLELAIVSQLSHTDTYSNEAKL